MWWHHKNPFYYLPTVLIKIHKYIGNVYILQILTDVIRMQFKIKMQLIDFSITYNTATRFFVLLEFWV